MENKCPKCEKVLTNHDCLSDESAKPAEGDISICIHCGSINKFNESLQLKEMTSEDLQLLQIESPQTYRELIRVSEAFNKFKTLN